MKNVLAFITALFILSAACMPVSAASTQELTLQTPSGTISLATNSEILDAKEELSKADINNEEKQKALAMYSKASDCLSKITLYQDLIDDLEKTIFRQQRELKSLSKILDKENLEKPLSSEYINSLTESELQALTEKKVLEQQAVQNEYDEATAEVSRIQTLPERAQSTIITNNESIRKLMSKIESSTDHSSFENRVLAVEVMAMKLENKYFNTQLSNISALQNLNEYKFKTATLRRSRIDKDVKALNARKTELLDEGDHEELFTEIASKHSRLSALIASINTIQGHCKNYSKKNSELSERLHVLDSDLSNISQIEKNINSQIQELGKTLVLSRLLNKQRTLIPDFTLEDNLNELIPNLNIYLYDVREMSAQLTDITETADHEISLDSTLRPFRKELIAVLEKRREVLSDIYQIIANQLALAIDIKMKNEFFARKKKEINDNIDEQLFWIKSNQPLSLELAQQFIPFMKFSFSNLLYKFKTDAFKKHTLTTVYFVLIPLIIFSIVAKLFSAAVIKKNNRLVRAIDTPNDSTLNTLTGIFYNIVMMLPKLSVMIIIGAIIICLSLSNSEKQTLVILTMCMHFFVYTFCLQIIKPNALVQRHFSVPPYKLCMMREGFNSVWFYVLPLLIFANIAEADVEKIFFDITSFSIILISFVALALISLKYFIKNLKMFSTDDTGHLFISFIALAGAICCVIAVASGYLYTAVKLLNSIAVTCYIFLGYYLVKETVHRTLHVSIAKHLNHKVNRQTGILSLIETNPSALTEKIFRLSQYALITITILLLYWQWSDIASVLSYLKSITVWSKISYINGIPTEVDSLTLANIFIAIVLFIFTYLLNRNLPGLLEKFILINNTNSNSLKSTGYTVKVISSYIIIGLGVIVIAGALGIKWENFQWLVAALSVGLGFGLQEIFANFVSGIILLFERQTRVGDIITLNGLSGTVKKIRIRATTVMSFENKEVLIPNRAFITSELTNWSLTSTVTKIVFDVGVAYNADVDLARKILGRIIRETNLISKENAPLIYIKELAESSVNFSCEVFVGDISNRKRALDYLCTRTLSEFRKAGIEIPFNQLDVNVKTLEKEEFIEQLKNGLFSKNEIKPEEKTL